MSRNTGTLLRLTVFALWCCISGCFIAFAQTITANIEGTVTDKTGSVIQAAHVTATNVATGVSVGTTTNGAGDYSIRFLQIGSYKITVEAKGFSTTIYGPYKLEIDQIARVDAKVSAGSVSESVIVSGDVPPILNTENSQIDSTFDANTIENIPLNGQNFSALMEFMPGAVSTQPASISGVGSVERSTGASGEVSVNGNRLQTNNYTWDGVEVNETISNLIGYAPAPDAIQEMKVVTANPNAEYGNANGGDVIMVMKSGTNRFHGSLFGHLEDGDLNANTWADKDVAPGTPFAPRPVYTQTQFGATIGGPIVKNKLFFFADYDAGRYHTGNVQQLYLASAKMRTGDFSELLDPNIMCSPGDSTQTCAGELRQLYDPDNNYAPYQGNLNVPILNPVAKYLYAHPEYYPEPNHSPDPGSPVAENFYGSAESYNRYDQGDVRVDYTPTSRDRFMAHYTQAEGVDGTTKYPVPVFFQQGSNYPDKIFVLSNVHTFSSSFVNELRAGYSRIRWNHGDPVDTTGAFGLHGDSTVGICNGCTQPFEGFAGQNVNGLNTPGNPAGGTDFIDNTFDYSEAITWQHGKHNSKAGVEFIRYQQNNFYAGSDGALGSFTYSGAGTSNTSVGSTGDGYSVADFVLDRVFSEGIGGVQGRTGQRQWRSAYYVQDDWRLTPKLTLNLGVRYEFDQPIYEVNNKEVNLNLATGVPEYEGAIPASNIYPNATVCPTRACYKATYDNIMPRVGFAYSATKETVVRGGYGTTTFLEGTGAGLRLTLNAPFQPSFQVSGVQPTGSTATLYNPGTFFKVENGFSSATVPNYGGGGTFFAYDNNLRPAFVSTYSLSVQQQINNQSALTIAYIGESGQHLIQAVYANQLHAPCVLNGVISTTPNSAECAAADPAPYQSLVGQGGVVKVTASEAMYNYNALQVQYRQRPIHGIEFTANYTFARAMSNSSGFFGDTNINGPSPYAENAYDNHEEYGPVGQDVRNSFNGTAVYALPVGRGRQFGANLNRALDEAIGGWTIGLTGVAYSGFPVTPSTDYNYAYTNNNNNRPNQYFEIPIRSRSKFHWFGNDPSIIGCTAAGSQTVINGGITTQCAYGPAAYGAYGNAKPNSLRGPGYVDTDATLSKDFLIFREHKIGFRADAFNVLNHPSLGNPNNDINSSQFGAISSVRSQERQLQLSAHYAF